jgi:hypothetical protein
MPKRDKITPKPAPIPATTADMSVEERLAQRRRTATKEKPKDTKKGSPVVFVDERDEELLQAVSEMIRSLAISKEMEDVAKNFKANAQDMLFRDWVVQVWEERNVPDNPRIAIRNPDGVTLAMSAGFQVKHKSDGIDLPKELPAGRTPIDHILMELMSPVVGLTAKNATALVRDGVLGEIVITKQYYLSSDFDSMITSEDAEIRSGVDKVLKLLMGEETEPCTAAEQEKILLERSLVRLKEGFIGRSFQYCDNADQLKRLLNYVGVVKSINKPEFAKGEKRSVRQALYQQAIEEFLFSKSKDDEENDDE